MIKKLSSVTGFRLKIGFALGAVIGCLTLPIPAAEPAWWTEGDPHVITGGPAQNDGIANIGQAKWMVSEALRVLDDIDPQVTPLIRADLAAIVDLSVPNNPKPPGWHDKQKAPLLVGQLKALAHPFYTHLNDRASVWILAQLQENGLSTLGADYFQDATGRYLPWNPETPVEQNKAPANIGQLKLVFSLRFRYDSDGDLMPDYWEYAYGLDPYSNDADSDPDGDGLTNYQEFLYGTNPHLVDTDGDGIPDGIEVANGTDPLDPESSDVFSGSNALVLTPLVD